MKKIDLEKPTKKETIGLAAGAVVGAAAGFGVAKFLESKCTCDDCDCDVAADDVNED